MRIYISPHRCTDCGLCVQACPRSAVFPSGAPYRAMTYDEHLRGVGAVVRVHPQIDQEVCDGCSDRIVPVCVAVCQPRGFDINLLV
jgi:Fe-S-cluster-containing hydrogenase component 2